MLDHEKVKLLTMQRHWRKYASACSFIICILLFLQCPATQTEEVWQLIPAQRHEAGIVVSFIVMKSNSRLHAMRRDPALGYIDESLGGWIHGEPHLKGTRYAICREGRYLSVTSRGTMACVLWRMQLPAKSGALIISS
jgi:hypothetical protein